MRYRLEMQRMCMLQQRWVFRHHRTTALNFACRCCLVMQLSQNLSDEDIHRLLNEQLEQAAPVNGGAAANTEEGQSAPSS